MIKLILNRIAKKDHYTIGKLYVNDTFICNTLEDKDRGLTQSMSLDEIKNKKVYGETAIPSGTYKVTTSVQSPRFKTKKFYQDVCNGYVPRILNVPGFDGILFHVGDGPRAQNLTEGCILIGKNTVVGQLTNGKEIFKNFYNKIKDDKNIILTIK